MRPPRPEFYRLRPTSDQLTTMPAPASAVLIPVVVEGTAYQVAELGGRACGSCGDFHVGRCWQSEG